MPFRCFSTKYTMIDEFKKQTIVNVNRTSNNILAFQLFNEISQKLIHLELRFLDCYQQDSQSKWRQVDISSLQSANIDKGWNAYKMYSPFPSIRNRIYLVVELNSQNQNRGKPKFVFYKLAGTQIINIIRDNYLLLDHHIPDQADRKTSIGGAFIIDLISSSHDEYNSDDEKSCV